MHICTKVSMFKPVARCAKMSMLMPTTTPTMMTHDGQSMIVQGSLVAQPVWRLNRLRIISCLFSIFAITFKKLVTYFARKYFFKAII